MSASWLRIANTPWPGATRVHLSFDLSNEQRPALGSIGALAELSSPHTSSTRLAALKRSPGFA
jgi:hypothetical protein